jgi:nitroreductase
MTTATLTFSAKKASPDYPIHKLLADRWSPYAFADRPVPDTDLSSLFEAARWAASSYNEQPWIYIVASKKNFGEFERILSCLVPENQAWAKAASVLALGIVSLRFSKTRKDNKAAIHDLGLASANLVMEATSRELSVHQMIGILPDTARELYQIPAHFEALTALAIGYPANADALPDGLRERDLSARQRKPTSQFVFSGTWGQSFPLTQREFTPATT